MENRLPYTRPLFWLLLAFAAAAVASIALQNILIWPAVALFFFAHWKAKEKIAWPSNLFAWATLLFLSTFFLGAIVGINPANSFQTVFKYLTLLLVFPLGAMALDSGEVRKLLSFFTYGAAFCALAGIGKHFFLHEDRISSFSGDKMVFAGMLMAALLLQLVFLKNDPKNPGHWVSSALLVWALVLTETRGAWLGFLAGFVLLAWRLKRNWLFIGCLVAVALFFVLPSEFQDRFKSIFHFWFVFNADHTISNASNQRFMMWQTGLFILKDHPWGIGQGNLNDIFFKYLNGAVFYDTAVPHLHNNFMQLLVQNGLEGLVAYLFWIFSFYRAALGFKSGDPAVGEMNWVLLCVFSAVLAWGMTEYTFSHQFMNVQFFLLGLQACLWATAAKRG